MKAVILWFVFAVAVFGDSIVSVNTDSLKMWVNYPSDCNLIKVGKLMSCGYADSLKKNGNEDLWKYWLHKTTKNHADFYISKWVRNGVGYEFQGNDTVDCQDASRTYIKPKWEFP